MKEDEAIDTFTARLTTLIIASIEEYSDLDEMSVEEAIGRLKTFEERIKVKKGRAFEDQDKLLFAKHNDNGQRHHYDNQGRGRYIPPHNRNHDQNRQHGKEENSKDEKHRTLEEDLKPTLLMASTSVNKTQRKSSKDTPTNKSIWFAKDYDHEDSKFGEIILEEDKEGHDQDYDKLTPITADWKAAKKILHKKPDLILSNITENGETSLHVAASAKRTKQVAEFVLNLVAMMEMADLELQNKSGNTALCLAAIAGNLETVDIYVNKNKTLAKNYR
ncbi:zinc finger, CCHC-type containing protein [Tanacetum coccineum]